MLRKTFTLLCRKNSVEIFLRSDIQDAGIEDSKLKHVFKTAGDEMNSRGRLEEAIELYSIIGVSSPSFESGHRGL